MTHRFCSIVTLATLLVAAAAVSWAGDFTPADYQKLERLTFQASDGKTLQYRFYKPEGIKKSRKYPLIIFLHGAGERGMDNDLQVRGQDMFLHLIFSEEGKKNKAFLVAPQCPPGVRWTEGVGLAGTPLLRVHELVEQIKQKFPIDKKRVYVTGVSMGGFGTWDWMVNYADETAAAVPICGWINVEKMCAVPGMKDKPVWIFHGDRDPAVRVVNGRNAYAGMQRISQNAKYTEYPGVAHNSWINAYREPELPKWLYKQKLGKTHKATKSGTKKSTKSKTRKTSKTR